MSDDLLTDAEEEDERVILEEIARAERVLSVEEIYERGYADGYAHAGLQSSPERTFRQWMLDRSNR